MRRRKGEVFEKEGAEEVEDNDQERLRRRPRPMYRPRVCHAPESGRSGPVPSLKASLMGA